VEGLAAIETAIARCEHNDERWYYPELLRIRGELLLREVRPDVTKTAEQSFLEALNWSRRLQMPAWQLRSAISLAKLYRVEHRHTEAQSILTQAYDRFTEGFDTADLREAKIFLARVA
jgi:hypothetical protein